MTERMRNSKKLKFSFGKNTDYFHTMSRNFNAFCWHDPGYGLGIPDYLDLENKIWGVMKAILDSDGIFLFNIAGVNIKLAQKGFANFEDAYGNNFVTEWELSIILKNNDYFMRTIFHNGVHEFRITKKGIKILWN